MFYIREVLQAEEQIRDLSRSQLFDINIHCMRTRFFKYFSNKVNEKEGRNYSIEALKNNTVHLSVPTEFDDPYDCNICTDWLEFSLGRVRYYARACGLSFKESDDYNSIANCIAMELYKCLVSGNRIISLIESENDNELAIEHKKYFELSILSELDRNPTDGNGYYNAINHVIQSEYKRIQETANRFRVACFGESPYSMLMWAHYADNHQGFCIEYETPQLDESNENIYYNLYPVIYTDTRIDLTSIFLNWDSTGRLSDDQLWDIYKFGLLSKSIDWKYQKEWRLISCDNLLTNENYDCEFFKIKKVYLGNRMKTEERKKVIEICNEKGITYSGVVITPDKYEMKDCNLLCENCNMKS